MNAIITKITPDGKPIPAPHVLMAAVILAGFFAFAQMCAWIDDHDPRPPMSDLEAQSLAWAYEHQSADLPHSP